MRSECVAVLLIAAILGFTDASTYAVVLLGIESKTTVVGQNMYELLMINPGVAEINVHISNLSQPLGQLTIAPGQLKSKNIEVLQGMNGTQFDYKALLVTSNDTFFLEVFSKSPEHTDGFVGIPLESFVNPNQPQTVYEYVVNTFCGTSGYCQMGVAAFQEAEVKLTFPPGVSEVIFCIDQTFFRSKRDSVMLLEKYRALQIETTADLTGTHLYSYSPFVVFVGSRNMTSGSMFTHTVEQLAPASQWGNNYAVKTLQSSSYGDILKISAAWPNTTVHMAGFDSFVISKKGEVVTRRLEMDAASLIEAFYPIQVVQITGVTSLTDDPPLPIVMVTVPAIEHSITSALISCGLTDFTAQFVTVSEITSRHEVNGMPIPDDKTIEYTKYKFSSKSSVGGPNPYFITGDKVAGIVMCDNNAALPLSIKVGTVSTTAPSQAEAMQEYNTTTCIESQTVEMTFTIGEAVKVFDRNFKGFSILKLRVISCGNVMVTLHSDIGDATFRLTSFGVIVTLCSSDSGCGNTEGSPVVDNVNSNGDCQNLMAWYWIKVIHQPHSTILCLGFGPVVNTHETCEGAPFKTESGQVANIHTLSFIGIFDDAFFHYDLETKNGCNAWVSEWRCQDKITNCSAYGESFCTDTAHADFASKACPNYCGKCTVDSDGKKFMFPVTNPSLGSLNSPSTIFITSTDSNAHIGVTLSDTTITRRELNDFTHAYQLPTVANTATVWIVSDRVVVVTVKYQHTAAIVYPVDAFSTEFLVFMGEVGTLATCHLLTEAVIANVIPYTRDGQPVSSSVSYGIAFSVAQYSEYELTELTAGLLNSGTILRSDRPVGVFCSNTVLSNVQIQLFPTYTFDKVYRVPKLDVNVTGRFQILIQAFKPNTNLKLKTVFSDTTHVLERIGDKEVVDVDTTLSYEVVTDQPVAVGMLYTDDIRKQLMMIPSPQSYTMNHVFPNLKNFRRQHVSYISETGGLPDTTEKRFGIGLYIGSTMGPLLIPTSSAMAQVKYQGELCHTSSPTVNDTIDNDCDGMVDEDLCYDRYGVYAIGDMDLDGDFGGDCRETLTEPVVIPKPDDPMCIDIYEYVGRRYIGYCWKLSTCPCSWVKGLISSKNLTQEQRNALLEKQIKLIQSELLVEISNLTAVKSKKLSAVDLRQSAANMGYIGITLFVLVFGCIFVMDLASLLRDLKILRSNLGDGMKRFCRVIHCNKGSIDPNK